jgi:hypothetical protein
MRAWTFLTIIVGLALYILAINDEVYILTSPPTFAWHILLRKTYSIGAFTLLGFLYAKLFRQHGRTTNILHTTIAIALYSAVIEVTQAFRGSHEGLSWHTFDIACGAVGGALGGILASYSSKSG